jgi:hypothetical protein
MEAARSGNIVKRAGEMGTGILSMPCVFYFNINKISYL